MHSKASRCPLFCLISTYNSSGLSLFFTQLLPRLGLTWVLSSSRYSSFSPYPAKSWSIPWWSLISACLLLLDSVSLVWEFSPNWLCASFTVVLQVFTTLLSKKCIVVQTSHTDVDFWTLFMISILKTKKCVCSLVNPLQAYQSFCN